MCNQNSNKRILIVDQNLEAANRIAEILDTNGFIAKMVPSISVGVHDAVAFRPDVVLVEVEDDAGEELQAAVELRQMSGPQAVHIIALTALSDRKKLDLLAAAGFDELVPKGSTADRILLSCR